MFLFLGVIVILKLLIGSTEGLIVLGDGHYLYFKLIVVKLVLLVLSENLLVLTMPVISFFCKPLYRVLVMFLKSYVKFGILMTGGMVLLMVDTSEFLSCSSACGEKGVLAVS